MKILVLTIDAFGGYGGIAQYNRDLIRALCMNSHIEEVVAIPRYVDDFDEDLPDKLRYITTGITGKFSFIASCFKDIVSGNRYNLILCTHINMLPLAKLMGKVIGCSVVPVMYGVEAWTSNRKWLINLACRSVKQFISIRRLTAQCFIKWTNIKGEQWHYLPNSIDTSLFKPMSKDNTLLERYGLSGKTIILTVGRLADEPHEKNKGFDEVIEVLEDIHKQIPLIRYLIVGEGPDMPRLKAKAERLGVSDLVVFAGRIKIEEKVAHYCLADVFAMPGSNKEFDRYPLRFVFLEALACGVPVVASKANGIGEADSEEAQLLEQVDPSDHKSIIQGILRALEIERSGISETIQPYGFESHCIRVTEIIDQLLVPNE